MTKVGNRSGACRLPNGLNFGYRIAPGFGRFIRGKTTPIHGADTPRSPARLRRVYQKARDNASPSSPYFNAKDAKWGRRKDRKDFRVVYARRAAEFAEACGASTEETEAAETRSGFWRWFHKLQSSLVKLSVPPCLCVSVLKSDRINKINRIGNAAPQKNPDNPVNPVKNHPSQLSAHSAALREPKPPRTTAWLVS